MSNPQPWTDIIPATFLPLNKDYQIDEDELRRLIRFLKPIPGITGLTCNGRAGDVSTLSREERRRVVEIQRNQRRAYSPRACAQRHAATHPHHPSNRRCERMARTTRP